MCIFAKKVFYSFYYLLNSDNMFKVLLVDDHVIFVNGLKKIINEIPDVEVVSVLNNSQSVIHYLNNNKIDLLITDLNMPEMNGVELIKTLRAQYPSLPIAVMTMYFNRHLIEELKILQVNGYLHKSIESEELEQAILKIKNGEHYYCNNILDNDDYKFIYNTDNIITDNFVKQYCFSKRELEIFLLIIENKSSTEIAEQLFISKDTVSTHRKNIIRKTNCHTPVEMFRLALELKLIK